LNIILTNSPLQVDISKSRLLEDFKKMGVKKGDHISVALSLKSIGHVIGGSETFIEAIIEAVGKDGTVMMNTNTRSYRLSKIHKSKIFDSKQTPTINGLVPETFRKRQGAIRSQHPVTSVTAYGKFAKYLTENHNENSRRFIPYSRLAQIGGKSLFIGTGNRLVSIRHEAQDLAGLLNAVKMRPRTVKYKDRTGKICIYSYYGSTCTRQLPKMVPILVDMQIVEIGRIGLARSIIASTKDLLYEMTEMLKEDPTLNLCDKIYCLWCRELERQKDLYNRIDNPKYFQKNIVLRKMITLINKYRARKT
jgi:aminoglycoside 3-N-acetyltransferase